MSYYIPVILDARHCTSFQELEEFFLQHCFGNRRPQAVLFPNPLPEKLAMVFVSGGEWTCEQYNGASVLKTPDEAAAFFDRWLLHEKVESYDKAMADVKSRVKSALKAMGMD